MVVCEFVNWARRMGFSDEPRDVYYFYELTALSRKQLDEALKYVQERGNFDWTQRFIKKEDRTAKFRTRGPLNLDAAYHLIDTPGISIRVDEPQ
jgi:hypothetical protein